MWKDYIIGSCKYRNEKIGVDELDLIRDYASVFGKGNNYYYYIFSKGKSTVRGRGYVDQRRWTRHFTASGTDGFRNKRVLNKKMRKTKEELSNWIVLFFFYVCYNYTKGEIQERVWKNIWKKIG